MCYDAWRCRSRGIPVRSPPTPSAAFILESDYSCRALWRTLGSVGPSHNRSVVTAVIVSSPADGCFGWTVRVMEGGKRRSSHSSPGDVQTLPPWMADGLSSVSEDDGFGGQEVPTTNVACPSHSLEPDDVFCTSVGKKILPALVQALGAEKVNVGASHSSTGKFVGFPVADDQHVTVGRSFGAAFDIDDTRGPSGISVVS
ncbi:hypothetical protein E2C01_069013 [Portunus trituberculatus]|uniref:Uncharacterized protein n=1 Tax=Portunus trituberculatus TaxID=210409 RepID=A0A5B7I1P1_PORTR|nr:hypothetical protein [Portunus trituberculatus]